MFMSITKKKYKLIKIDTNTYYELMFILLMFILDVEIDKKNMLAETMFLRIKDKKH